MKKNDSPYEWGNSPCAFRRKGRKRERGKEERKKGRIDPRPLYQPLRGPHLSADTGREKTNRWVLLKKGKKPQVLSKEWERREGKEGPEKMYKGLWGLGQQGFDSRRQGKKNTNPGEEEKPRWPTPAVARHKG